MNLSRVFLVASLLLLALCIAQMIGAFGKYTFNTYHIQLDNKIELVYAAKNSNNLIYNKPLYVVLNGILADSEIKQTSRYTSLNIIALLFSFSTLLMLYFTVVHIAQKSILWLFVGLLSLFISLFSSIGFNLEVAFQLFIWSFWLFSIQLFFSKQKHTVASSILLFISSTLLISSYILAPWLMLILIIVAYFNKNSSLFKSLLIIQLVSIFVSLLFFQEAWTKSIMAPLQLFAQIFQIDNSVFNTSLVAYKLIQLVPITVFIFFVLGLITFFKNYKKKGYSVLQIFSLLAFIVIVLMALILPKSIKIGFESLFYIVFPLLIFIVISLESSDIKWFKGKYLALVIIAFVFGITNHVMALNSQIPSYNYANPYLFNFTNRFLKEPIDYYHTASFKLLKHTAKNHNDEQILSNFASYLPDEKKDRIIKVNYSQRNYSNWTLGVFSRSTFTVQQKQRPSFPPQNTLETKLINGITVAAKAVHQDSITYAFELLRAGENVKSVKLFKSLKQKYPKDESVYYGLARGLFNLGTWDDAFPFVYTALSFNPSYSDALCLIAELLQKQNKLTEAENYYLDAIEANKDNDRAYWALANLKLRAGDFSTANEWLDSAINKNGSMLKRAIKTKRYISLIPPDMDVGENAMNQVDEIAQTAESLDDPRIEQMGIELDTLIALDSANAKLRIAKGMWHLLKQDFRPSILSFDAAVKINPNFKNARNFLAIARVNYGAVLFEQDSIFPALFNFQSALGYRPKDQAIIDNVILSYCALAERSLEEDNIEEALSYYAKGLELKENSFEVYKGLGFLYLKINEIEKAEQAFYRSHIFYANDKEVVQELLNIYRKWNNAAKVKVYQDKLKSFKDK